MSSGFNMGPFPGGSGGNLFLIIFTSVFVLVIGTFIILIIKSLRTWSSNNASPIQSRNSKVVAKRMHVSGGSGDSSTSTSYYATFEFEDRSRLELWVGREQFGYIVEGDQGTLTYQGTRFKEFFRPLL
ncbi:putative alpha/beta hydrolase family protein [Paenibacillus sp. V4I3]|uniref:DUF2500 domain-containing protein n=1 Tax=unclassified Paenibacillus TaxID=185978 RepID=UPI002787E0DB|nr:MULTISPECIES: DUF2500 domain-containing protein [unclassified Paenibacillus]MDQ0872462.1 putative alpha/beta hydrolase family protein [Paenibacillus sp. V4I3]MDQ0891653.1 putative alpha/beta hydrolase family protein [Paenibacillus sp. V4I9]